MLLNNLKLLLFICLLSIAKFALAKSASSIDLYLPGVQMRYQDTTLQTRELENHYLYSFAYSVNERVTFGLEYSLQQEASGNTSFQIGRKYSEMNLAAQFTAFQRTFDQVATLPIGLKLGPKIVYGFGESKLITSLQGTSREDRSERQSVFGAGFFAQFDLNQFLIEGDVRYQTSKNYEPNSIWLGTVRIGYAIQL